MDGILELDMKIADLERYLELIHDRPRNELQSIVVYLHDDDKRTHIRTVATPARYQPGPYIGTWHWYVPRTPNFRDIWYFRCSSVLNAIKQLSDWDISIDPLKVKVAELFPRDEYTKRERNVLESGVAPEVLAAAKQ
ncbi:hypothetical protein SPFM8_00157 [Salmonella phage SPFM8]|nr:hypothetical protein SPFM8_00157 [Salmonella phage SPFM8]